MKPKSVLTAFFFVVFLLFSQNGFAAFEPIGKIYLSGTWVSSNQETNAPIALINNFIQLLPPANPRKLAEDFFSLNAPLLQLNSQTKMEEIQVLMGSEIETHRFQKRWNGLEVVGGEALLHIQNGKILFASGDASSLIGLSPRPRLSTEEAQRIAFSSYSGRARSAANPVLQILLLGNSEQREAKLAYNVKVNDSDLLSSDNHFIDATSGQELLVTSNVQSLASRQVLAGLGSQEDFQIISDTNSSRMDHELKIIFSERGCALPTSDEAASVGKSLSGQAPSNPAPCQDLNPATMASALAAWTNSGLVHDYYQNTHRRNSVDGNGLPLRSIVNFGGESFQNAAWFDDRKIMLYGNGGSDGRFNDFASPLDVVAHEITHGVTSSTAALQYASEQGALNESYSDVFGKLVAFSKGKASDWKIGRELFRDGSSFIRDMENPSISHYNNFRYRGQTCHRFNDYCGVHENSGIPNRAAVLIAKKIGLDRLGKIYYLTLTQLLRSSSDFKEAKAQTLAACTTLFGQQNPDCKAVSDAFESVGI